MTKQPLPYGTDDLDPNVVVQKKSSEGADGYDAVQLGTGEKREKLFSKAAKGHLEKAGVPLKRHLKESRLSAEEAAELEVGQELGVDQFETGERVDVIGNSKGRGFTGVMKRHNFAGAGTVGHGTHEAKRHGGSIGMNMTPGRTLRGQKMAGQHGNKKATILNLRIVRVLPEENIVLVDGGVPGPRNGFITVKGAIKKAAVALPDPPAKEEPAEEAPEATEEG